MDTDIYICSKPLQYFNVRNIGYGNASSKKVLIILGHFRDAELFFHQVKTFDDTWNDILYFKDLFHLDLYLFFHPVNTLFVEVDASFVYGIFFKLSRFKRMYMFEEGFGSYRRDRFDNSKGLKNIINKLTGVGDHIGFSKFLTGQFLYLPDLYRSQFPGYSKSLKSFQKPFVKITLSRDAFRPRLKCENRRRAVRYGKRNRPHTAGNSRNPLAPRPFGSHSSRSAAA